MAVTWAVNGAIVEGVASNGKRTKKCVLNPTGTYTTGGDALSPAAFGLKGITGIYQQGSALTQPGFNIHINTSSPPEAPLLQLFETNLTEVAGAVSVTGRQVTVLVEGF